MICCSQQRPRRYVGGITPTTKPIPLPKQSRKSGLHSRGQGRRASEVNPENLQKTVFWLRNERRILFRLKALVATGVAAVGFGIYALFMSSHALNSWQAWTGIILWGAMGLVAGRGFRPFIQGRYEARKRAFQNPLLEKFYAWQKAGKPTGDFVRALFGWAIVEHWKTRMVRLGSKQVRMYFGPEATPSRVFQESFFVDHDETKMLRSEILSDPRKRQLLIKHLERGQQKFCTYIEEAFLNGRSTADDWTKPAIFFSRIFRNRLWNDARL